MCGVDSKVSANESGVMSILATARRQTEKPRYRSMGKKALAVVPVLGKEAKLERFHGDAIEKPLYEVVTWSSPYSAGTAPQVRKRQLAIVGSDKKLLEMQRFQAPADARSWFIGNDVQQGR